MYNPKIYGFKIFSKRGSKYENMKLGDLFPEDKLKEKLEIMDKEKEKDKEKTKDDK